MPQTGFDKHLIRPMMQIETKDCNQCEMSMDFVKHVRILPDGTGPERISEKTSFCCGTREA